MDSLAPYADKIKAATLPTARISLTAAESLPVTASKLGGVPYWPADMEYPRGTDGNPLFFLAQYNCAEVALEPLPNHGLLQFFISIAPDARYGANGESLEQKDFRVIFHAAPDELMQTAYMGFLDKFKAKQCPFPQQKTWKMAFNSEQMPPAIGDYRFTSIMDINAIPPDNYTGSDLEKAYAAYRYHHHKEGSRIGGYPSFVQPDPRLSSIPHKEKDFLLLQIEDDTKNGIAVCDAGAFAFLANSSQVKKMDFSEVLFNLDTY